MIDLDKLYSEMDDSWENAMQEAADEANFIASDKNKVGQLESGAVTNDNVKDTGTETNES